jgi:hypothetical protein
VRTSTFLSAVAVAIGLAAFSSPALSQATAKASSKSTSQTICKDGTTSTAKGRGACSSHGGVDTLATAAAQKSAKAEKARAQSAKASGDSVQAAQADAKAKRAERKATKAETKAEHDSTGATAQCKDGTYSHAKSTQGACSTHGGIARTIKG